MENGNISLENSLSLSPFSIVMLTYQRVVLTVHHTNSLTWESLTILVDIAEFFSWQNVIRTVGTYSSLMSSAHLLTVVDGKLNNPMPSELHLNHLNHIHHLNHLNIFIIFIFIIFIIFIIFFIILLLIIIII